MWPHSPKFWKSPRKVRSFFLTSCGVFCLLLLCGHSWRNKALNLGAQISLYLNADPRWEFWLTQELAKLMNQNVSSVEDFGEAFLTEWFKREKEWCEREKSAHETTRIRPRCRATCAYQNQSLFNVPHERLRNLIVIPYRNRADHLRTLLPRLHEILSKRHICFLIVVAEQAHDGPFNKGAVMNAAVTQALDLFPFHCITLHDVDLVPLNDEVPYNCPSFPRHTSVQVDKFDNKLPYLELIGGILSIPVKIYLQVNGFSNLYWGWGAEDDDMYYRLSSHGIPITRADTKVAQFHMLPHEPSPALPPEWRYQVLSFSESRHRLDGLNSLNFTVLKQEPYSSWMISTDEQAANISSANLDFEILHFLIDIGSAPHWLRPR